MGYGYVSQSEVEGFVSRKPSSISAKMNGEMGFGAEGPLSSQVAHRALTPFTLNEVIYTTWLVLLYVLHTMLSF